jgi:mannose-6-phosphate isomerase-like protein (cupin superfamily)
VCRPLQAAEWSDWADTRPGVEAFFFLEAGAVAVEVSPAPGEVALGDGDCFLVPSGCRYRWRVNDSAPRATLGFLLRNKVAVVL